MSVAAPSQQQSVEHFRKHDSDSGSPEVQIVLLTHRINHLTGHMRLHSKDYASRRGLLQMVSRRRSLLDYVRKHDPNRYLDVIGQLGIRK